MNSVAQVRPIIVIGPERSGTSVVAEMILTWGAYPGELESLRKADVQNPRGYFEYLPIWDFLVDMGVNWWDPGFQERLSEKVSDPHHRQRAAELVAQMEKGGRSWVWKDPALSFFLPFWNSSWKDPIYVVCVRNPSDTARSWAKFTLPSDARDKNPFIQANLLRWHYIMLLILSNTEDVESKIFLSYEKLMKDPADEARKLAMFLNAECGMIDSGSLSTSAMAGAVDPQLWHNRSGATPEANLHLKNLYGFVAGKTVIPSEPFRPEDFPLPPRWRETVVTSERQARIYRDKSGPTNT